MNMSRLLGVVLVIAVLAAAFVWLWRTNDARVVTDLLIADTRKAQPETVRDMKNGSTVRDLALFSDDELLLLDNWLDDFHVSAWDLKSRKARMLCSGGFGDIRRKGEGMIYGRRSPSAIAVNAKLGLIAAVINDHIRILRYKRNPNGVYSKLAEC
jgi:hypothetical protein